VSVAQYLESACALNAAGAATCWPPEAGFSGIGGTFIDIAVSGGAVWTASYFTGDWRVCAVDTSGLPVCFASTGVYAPYNPPLSPPGFPYSRVEFVSANKACFLRADAIDCVTLPTNSSTPQAWVTIPGEYVSMARDSGGYLFAVTATGRSSTWSASGNGIYRSLPPYFGY
jgi:hypothetical protein